MSEKGDISMEVMVKDNRERIIILEKRVDGVETNYIALENTILKGNQSQQDFFRDTMNKQWDLINSRDQSKNEESARSHEESARKHELAKTKIEKYSEIIIKVAGAGGILLVVFELVFGS